jgi:hypothetical protein
MAHDWEGVLRYTKEPIGNESVKRAFRQWQTQQGLLERCFFADCPTVATLQTWRGAPLTMILDHINGVNSDNRPENLRWVCPNCNSQLPTYGGRNIGRVADRSEGGFAVQEKDPATGEKRRHFTLPAEPGHFAISGGDVELRVARAPARDDSSE